MSRIDITYDARWWIPVDLDTDPRDWVPGVVALRWAEETLSPDGPRIEAVTASVCTVVQAIQDADPPAFLALMLQPRADDGIAAVATLRVEELDEQLGREEVLRILLAPEQMLEAPAEISDVDTRGGRAVRVRQRVRVPQDPTLEVVAESLAYVWWATDEEGSPILMVFSSSLEDLVAAEQIRPMIDEVAATIAIVGDDE